MANIRAKKKAPKLPPRIKTGIAACPRDDFRKARNYFHYDLDGKDCSTIMKKYIRKSRKKEEVTEILKYPEWAFKMFAFRACTAWWVTEGLEMTNDIQKYKDDLDSYIDELVATPYVKPGEIGEDEVDIKVGADEKPVPVKEKPNPQKLMAAKINSTILTDLDDWEAKAYYDEEKNEKLEIDVFALMTQHQLKTAAPAKMVREWCEERITQYSEPKEYGYDHLTKRVLNARIKCLKTIIEDADRYTLSLKAARKPRVAKPKAADKQVAKLKFMPRFDELKLTSINPTTVVGALRLYTYNTKTKELTEYLSLRREGMEVSGTTIKGYDLGSSRRVKLRKPNDFLSIVLKKTPNQINKAWDDLTTKTYEGPNGRIGADVILLRVSDK